LRILAYIFLALCTAAPAYASKASDAYHKAEKLEKAGKVIEAFLLYTEASTLAPENEKYRAKKLEMQVQAEYLQRMRPKAATPNAAKPDAAKADAAKPDVAKAEPAAATQDQSAAAPAAPAPDPDPDFINITTREIDKARQLQPPAQLKLATGRFDFHFSGSPTDLFNQVAERCGVQAVYDSEYATTATPKVRFDIEDVDCRSALQATEAATNSFVAPLSSKLMLVSKDSVTKRQANEQTMSVVIPVPTALSTQDLTEIAQAIKQVTGIEKLAWNSSSNEIVIRDRVSRVIIARPLIEQLIAFRGGVVFDLRFLQLSDSEMLSFGIDLTNTFNVVLGGNPLIAAMGGRLNDVVRALEHGVRAFGINGLSASVVATLTESKSRTLLQQQIRSVNGMPATLHVGDRYPVLTSGYFGPSSASTSTNGASVYTPPPSFTYQDLGVSLKIVPVIGNNDLITLDVETEYQLLAGQAINGIPILANRKFSTRISIHNDEWAIIGGLMDSTNMHSVSGVAGLARIPLFGWLFKTQNITKDRDHIVIVMRPHLVGDPPSNNETAPMRVGTETRPLSPI
jgi:Flp pilus assembly secretin CpaC